MVTCFVDHKTRDGTWHKRWSTLLPNSPVYSLDELQNLVKDSPQDLFLFVVHDSACGRDEWRNLKSTVQSLLELPPYLMFVNAVGLDRRTSDDGRIHSSTIPFPGETSLSHLTDRLRRLAAKFEPLPAARAQDSREVISQRRQAWNEWETNGHASEIAWALRLLCEAWLLKNWPDVTAYPKLQTLRATLQIQGEKPQLPEDIDLRPPSNRDEWLNPFREAGDTTDPLPAILNEISTDDAKTVVKNFFSKSPETFAPTFDDVADLFLSVNTTLKASS